MTERVLSIENLQVQFKTYAGTVQAIRGVDFQLHKGETLAIVGESGSGKTVIALSVMGLLPENAQVSGSIRLAGRELVGRPEKELRKLRGDVVSMVFQEPMTALDPTMRVGRQIGEVVALHHAEHRGEIRALVLDWLAHIGLPDPERIADSFPHQLSGGQRQRVNIARALMNSPELLVVDEPTSALDPELVGEVEKSIADAAKSGQTMILVSHDMSFVAQVADKVLFLDKGKIIESGTPDEIINHPKEERTKEFFASYKRTYI